jgi:hypothetical protein
MFAGEACGNLLEFAVSHQPSAISKISRLRLFVATADLILARRRLLAPAIWFRGRLRADG